MQGQCWAGQLAARPGCLCFFVWEQFSLCREQCTLCPGSAGLAKRSRELFMLCFGRQCLLTVMAHAEGYVQGQLLLCAGAAKPMHCPKLPLCEG